MSQLVNVVQFPHPGPEHVPGHDRVMPWNVGRHRRKFLHSPGQWIDGKGDVRHGDMTFWGEWEAPSRVIRRWMPQTHLPSFLQEPFITELPDGRELQNTDPLVFGSHFRYSNCKQFDQKNGTPTGLQDLEPGSVILFGSKRRGTVQFVLDTVFVVARGRSYAPATVSCLFDEPFVRRVVVEPLLTWEGPRSQRFTLFDGATPDDAIDGMFSFVPCLPFDGDFHRFSRPVIELPEFVNPRSQQSPGGYTRRDRVELATAYGAWRSVADQVEAAGCRLGYDLPEPPHENWPY